MSLLNKKASDDAVLPEKEVRGHLYPARSGGFFSSCALILVSIFMLSACASTEDVGRVQYNLGELDKKVKELDRRSQVIEKEIPKSEKQISEKIEGAKDSQEATARAVSNLFMKVQAFSGDIQQITGRLDESQHLYESSLKDEAEKREVLAAEISGLEVLLEDLKSKLADMNAGMEAIRSEQALLSEKVAGIESRRVASKKNVTKKTDAEKTEPAKTDKIETDVPEAAVQPGVKDIYDAALELFKTGKYKDARAKFTSVLKEYEENEYSDNAKFWIGESYFKEKKFEDSILAYEELLKNYPDSDKIPSARLKQGIAFYELDDQETGDIILKSLIESFPDSEEAAAARKKLGIEPAPIKESE